MQDQNRSFDTPTLADPDKVALFLDLDGTVLDIAQVPEEVTTPPDLTAVLGRLQARLDGALAVLTGRKIEDVDRLLSPLRLTAAGVHGSEIRFEPEGNIETGHREVPARLVEALQEFVAATPGLLLEHKGISIAVHYRAVPRCNPRWRRSSAASSVVTAVVWRSRMGAACSNSCRMAPPKGRRSRG